MEATLDDVRRLTQALEEAKAENEALKKAHKEQTIAWRLESFLETIKIKSAIMDLHPDIRKGLIHNAIQRELSDRRLSFDLSPERILMLSDGNGNYQPAESLICAALDKYNLLEEIRHYF